MPTIKRYRLRSNFSTHMRTYPDGSWSGAVVTAAGIVLADSDVKFGQTYLQFVWGGYEYSQWIERACTPRGAAIRAGRFVRQVLEAAERDQFQPSEVAAMPQGD